MKSYETGKIRNICFAGHGRSGKSTLCEAILYRSGAIDRMGSTDDGTSVMDFDPEEAKRSFSISTSVAPAEWKDYKINLIDTPGYFDFIGGVYEGIRGADSVVICVSGKTGVAVGTEKAFRAAANAHLPIAVFISKIENEHGDYDGILEQVKSRFGAAVIPFNIPVLSADKKIEAIVDAVAGKAYKFSNMKREEIPIPDSVKEAAESAKLAMIEQVAETDEALMEKYFAEEPFTDEELENGIRAAIKENLIIPVFAGESPQCAGVEMFMDTLMKYMPSPTDRTYTATDKSGNELSLTADSANPFAAVVFKTVADPFVGKLSIFRVVSGEIKPDTMVYNPNKDASEKIGKLYIVNGKKQTETDKACAGDIVAVTKLAKTGSGDTLCCSGNHIELEGVSYPKPIISLAVLPVNKGDEEKISQGLARLHEEDPTFEVSNNAETHQMIISGQGEQHLDIITSKLKSKYGVSCVLEEPIIAFREAIKGKVKVEGKHKKQSGGHGQYGHVIIEFEPGSGEGLEFCESVFGGSVPKNYFPAVEKGLEECMQHGVIAGYPVVSLKATLLDGSYHPVDSSEMAFKVAAGLAFKSGLAQANPVLLEPVGFLKVTVPEVLMGDVIGDINKRRGRIMGMNSGVVEAEVPVCEMAKYATDLRSMTQGRGEFEFNFVRYEEAPKNIVDKVIASAAKEN